MGACPSHAAGTHSVKAEANGGSGKGGCVEHPVPSGSTLGAVVLFTVGFVSQDTVHLVHDGGG